tara:strand:- start:1137 stop:1730 length:594 start_codon:yes stop_codon:yes gene_type:complete
MNNNKDLKYFKNLMYNVILRKNNGLYYLFIPELSIIVENEDLEDAFNSIESEKQIYFENVIKLGFENTVNEPKNLSKRKKLYSDLKLFIYKTVMVGIIFLVIIMLSISSIKLFVNKINRVRTDTITSIKQIPVDLFSAIPYQINEKFTTMTPIEKEEQILKLRNLIDELRPYFKEVYPLFEDDYLDSTRHSIDDSTR